MTLNYPHKGLVNEFELYRKRKPTITLVVKRDVVSPAIFRNANTDRAETQEFGGDLHAQVNGEKFVSKERLTGLDLLRHLSEKFSDVSAADWNADIDETPPGLISPEYTYNEPDDLVTVLNLDVLTYGITGTGDVDYSFKSRVKEAYTFSTHPYDLLNKETRNAVYESGTMQNAEGEQSQALYEYAPIQLNNSFVHFVTLEAATPAMLLYVLHNILTTGEYGARETRTGKNIKNKIIGVILGDHGTSLSAGELLRDYRTDRDIVDDVTTYIEDEKRSDWDIYGDELSEYPDFPEWYLELVEVAGRKRDDAEKILYQEFSEFTEETFNTLIIDE